jgi:hypothetical protein
MTTRHFTYGICTVPDLVDRVVVSASSKDYEAVQSLIGVWQYKNSHVSLPEIIQLAARCSLVVLAYSDRIGLLHQDECPADAADIHEPCMLCEAALDTGVRRCWAWPTNLCSRSTSIGRYEYCSASPELYLEKNTGLLLMWLERLF